jgi:hypothetical protein
MQPIFPRPACRIARTWLQRRVDPEEELHRAIDVDRLRAPALRRGDTLLVRFSEAAYRQALT